MLQNESHDDGQAVVAIAAAFGGRCACWAAAVGAAMLRGPARGDESEKHSDAAKAAAPATARGRESRLDTI